MKAFIILFSILIPVVFTKSVVDTKKLIRFIATNADSLESNIEESKPLYYQQPPKVQQTQQASSFSYNAPQRKVKKGGYGTQVSTPQKGYATQTAQQAGYGSQQASYGGGQQTSYGGQQASYGGQQASYGGQQASYGGQQASYGGQQASYGGQQASYGGQQASYGQAASNGGCQKQSVLLYDQPILEYCLCPDYSYGFSCNQAFGNPCRGNQFYPAHSSLPSNYFIHCAGTYPYLKICPGGTVWNQELVTCAWPESYYAQQSASAPGY